MKPLVLIIVGMKHPMVDVKDAWFLLPETEIVAMTLTPPFAGKNAFGKPPNKKSEINRMQIEQESNNRRTEIQQQANPN